ncbi:hypothetical protein ACLB2K_050529 [Fragaria x ananassa]
MGVEHEEGEDDFVRLRLANEDYSFLPPRVAELMGIKEQKIYDEVTETEDVGHGGDNEQDHVEIEDVTVEETGG